MLSATEKERAQNEKILRVVKEQAPATFADAIRFIISAIASGALGIQKKVVKKNSQKAFDGCDACNWAMMYYHLESRDSAVLLFQALMEAGQLEDVDGKKEFKDDEKRSYFATKTLFMYDVHLEKFRADVETVIKEEIARRKGQTLQDKEKRDIKARAQSTLKKATQSLKFARGPAPVWGTPSVLEVEHDGRRLSVIRPDAEELKHTIMRMSKARADEPREGASSPSSRVRIEAPLSSSPPTRRALSPNTRSRAAEDLLPPPPTRAAPTLGRSGSPLAEPPSPTQAPTPATAAAAPTEASADKGKDDAKHRARPVTTALTRKEQAAAAERKPTILQVTPQMTSQAHIKDVLSDAQELLKMHRAGLTGNMTDGEWKGFALSSVDMLERLMGTVVALHMHKRKQEDDIRTLKGLIQKRDPAAPVPSLSSVSSPSRRTMAPTPKKSTRDTTLLHNMRVEVAPNPSPSTTETDAPPRRASQHLPPEEKVAKPVVAKSEAVKAAPEPTQEKTKSEAPPAAGAGTWVPPGAPKAVERKAEHAAPKPVAVATEEKKPAAQDNNKVRGTMDKVVEPYPENVAKRRKEVVTKLGYDLFEALKNPTYDTTKLETYLTGHEFQACFLMTPADFAALPRHTQIQAKRNIGL